MNKEQHIEKLSKKLIELINRETIDKFIEDEEGNLKEIRTYSVSEIARSLYNICWRQVGDTEENFISKKALIACENNKTATEHFLIAEKVIEKVRQETAKEILRMLSVNKFVMEHPLPSNRDYWIAKWICEKYGVEVEQ